MREQTRCCPSSVLPFFEAERVDVHLARPDLPVDVDRQGLRRDLGVQVEGDAQRVAGKVARGDHEVRLRDMRLFRDVERVGRARAVAVVEDEVASAGLRVRVHLHVEDQQMVEGGRRLRIALGREDEAGDGLQLQVVVVVEEVPPVALLPVGLLRQRLGRERTMRLLLDDGLVLEDVVQPVHHELVLRLARRARLPGHHHDARDPRALAGDPGALHAVDGVAAHDDARLRAHLHAGRMVVARLGEGQGGGGAEAERRDDTDARVRHRSPSDGRTATSPSGS